MSSLCRSSSVPRRAFVHGLVEPLHRSSCRHASLISASRFGLAPGYSFGCRVAAKSPSWLLPFNPLRIASACRERILHRRCFVDESPVCFSTSRTVTSPSSRPNLKYEYEAQVSSCLGAQASRSQRLAEPSFSATGRIPHPRPNPPIERTLSGRLRLPPRSAHVAR